MNPNPGDKDDNEADSFRGSFYIPADEDEWKQLVGRGNLKGKTIHTIEKMKKGSKPFKKQFLMMKAIWPPAIEPFAFLEREISNYGLEDFMADAERIVAASWETQRYLQLLKDIKKADSIDEQSPYWAGSFMPVIRLQAQCALEKTPRLSMTTRASKPRGKISTIFARMNTNLMFIYKDSLDSHGNNRKEVADENIVNAALILFLEAINGLISNRKSDWTFERIFFNANYAKAKYKAFTDGSLKTRIGNYVQSILEVKKGTRSQGSQDIAMQESAEISAWILNTKTEGWLFNNQ